MQQLEYNPILIESHRKYLRSLAHPLPAELASRRSRRQALGSLLVRFGLWLQDKRPQPAGTVANATSAS